MTTGPGATTGGSADTLNNAEGVFLEFPPANVTLRVLASNINSDGVPNFNDETDQDFALVCSNCLFTPGYALLPDPVTHIDVGIGIGSRGGVIGAHHGRCDRHQVGDVLLG